MWLAKETGEGEKRDVLPGLSVSKLENVGEHSSCYWSKLNLKCRATFGMYNLYVGQTQLPIYTSFSLIINSLSGLRHLCRKQNSHAQWKRTPHSLHSLSAWTRLNIVFLKLIFMCACCFSCVLRFVLWLCYPWLKGSLLLEY